MIWVGHSVQGWDSEMLGLACGSLELLQGGPDGMDLARTLVRAVPDGEVLTVVKVPGSYPETAACLATLGGVYLGREITFHYRGPSPQARKGVSTEVTARFESDEFLAMAGEMGCSRFFLDREIPRERALALWRESIHNHCWGRASALAVGLVDGSPAGLAVALDREAGRELFVVGVLPGFRRRGVGAAVLRAAVEDAGARPVRVEAFADNLLAVRLYERCGFVPESEAVVLHLWRHRMSAAA